jgi:hypothetical protein
MKLGTVLTACDLNPLYSEFIPNFIKAWNILFPLADVVIVLIADKIPEYLKEYETNLKLFKPIVFHIYIYFIRKDKKIIVINNKYY